MRLYVCLKYFTIHWPEKEKFLILERSTHRIFTKDKFSFEAEGIPINEVFFIDIFTLLGVIPIDSCLYIAVVTKADVKGNLRGSQVYEIKEIELIEFTRSENMKCQENEKNNIKKLFSSGFFFSFTYLLTRNSGFAKQFEYLHEDSDCRFYWNLSLYKEFIGQGVEPLWFVPIIQGFFSIFTDQHVGLALISRRSCERAGTRYNCRGVDDWGNVANFVETEQILIVDGICFSYLQIRGSVPIYWEQTGVTAALTVTKSHELSLSAFQKHIDRVLGCYNHVTFVNLLSIAKSYECELTQEWKKAFDKLFPAYKELMAYVYFDFHSNCKGQKFHKVNLLIEKLSLFIDYYGYYSSLGKTQQGVIRTNCLDCLDRTNVVQSKIAWEVLLRQLRTINKDFEMTQDQNFTNAFKLQWADNGDYLSLQYTGTGSTISSVTRTDKQGFRALIKQGLTSIERFYNANMEDDTKQLSIDHILRKKNKTQIVNKLNEELERRSSEYSENFDIKLRIVTWNLDNKPLNSFCSITETSENCQIVVFAFQQIQKFIEFEDCLSQSMVGYSKLNSIVNENFAFVIFVEDSLISDITLFNYEHFYLPYKGKKSSKQCAAVSFNLHESSFCLIACHLASGTDNSIVRREQISFIQSHPFTTQKFDSKFLFGDLNFRVDLGSFQIIQNVSTKNYENILKSEQLTHNLKFGYLPEFKEAKIEFPPSFPYVEGTNEYDKNRKRPCWRDRILYEGKVEPLAYLSIADKVGVHRPVEGIFVVKVKKVNEQKRKDVELNIFEELAPAPLGIMPKKMNCAKDLLRCS